MKKEKFITILIFVLGATLIMYLKHIRDQIPGENVLSPISKSVNIFSFFGKKQRPQKIIYGYLPYWTLNTLEFLQLDKLTDIAYFGVYINADGSFKKTIVTEAAESDKSLGEPSEVEILEPGYDNWINNEDLRKLIELCNKNNVRVSLTIISHVDEVSDQFLDCEDCWNTLIQNIKTELKRNNIKDVNLNFEYAKYTDGDRAEKYSRFTKLLNDELDNEFGDSFVVVSTFADSVVKPRVTNIEELGKVADMLFIMGYDFHRPTSDNAGPVAPIDGKGVHAEYDLRTMVQDYVSKTPPNKLILGVPYYGYNWLGEEDVEYATRVDGSEDAGYSQSQTYADIMDTILEVGPEVKWDELGQTPYFTYVSPSNGSLREVYFENEDSLAEKYKLARENGFAGVGIWALGYDGGYVELWNLIQREFISN